MRGPRTAARFGAGLVLWVLCGVAAAANLTVGSKRFTESYILGEIIANTARKAGEAQVSFKPGLGNTAVVFAALKSGAIDVYPEYSGTIAFELLRGRSGTSMEELNRALAVTRRILPDRGHGQKKDHKQAEHH